MDMDQREIISLALQLQNLLLAHDKALTQIQLIDAKSSSITTKIFSAQLGDQLGVMLQFLTRKSVMDGMKLAYQQYRYTKWTQIQDLSTLILKTLQADGSTLPEPPRPVSEPESRTDNFVPVMMEMFSVYSRNE